MITPSQIREKNLSTVQSGGYDKEEVNALLAQIVESYQAVYDENKELYRKMEILAGKIEEYRSEEDSIKTALITAQKMADRIAKDAKEKAEVKLSASAATAQQTVTDAKEKADKMVAEARTQNNDAFELRASVTSTIGSSDFKNTAYKLGLYWVGNPKSRFSPVVGVGYSFHDFRTKGLNNYHGLYVSIGYLF